MRREVTIGPELLKRWAEMIRQAEGQCVVKEISYILRGSNEQRSGDKG